MSFLKIHWAEVTQRRMEPFLVVDLVQELAEVKSHMNENMVTKWDLELPRAETRSGFEGLRLEMIHMIRLQGGPLATLILGLAGIMVGLALVTEMLSLDCGFPLDAARVREL